MTSGQSCIIVLQRLCLLMVEGVSGSEDIASPPSPLLQLLLLASLLPGLPHHIRSHLHLHLQRNLLLGLLGLAKLPTIINIHPARYLYSKICFTTIPICKLLFLQQCWKYTATSPIPTWRTEIKWLPKNISPYSFLCSLAGIPGRLNFDIKDEFHPSTQRSSNLATTLNQILPHSRRNPLKSTPNVSDQLAATTRAILWLNIGREEKSPTTPPKLFAHIGYFPPLTDIYCADRDLGGGHLRQFSTG